MYIIDKLELIQQTHNIQTIEYVLSRYLFNLLMMIFGCSFYSLLYLISKKLNIMENLTLDYKTILYTGIFISILLISVCIPLE